jgi:hypothetical protein
VNRVNQEAGAGLEQAEVREGGEVVGKGGVRALEGVQAVAVDKA